MKIYFFGDVHGNGEALERVLHHAEEMRADEIICLGDIVGWLPWGKQTLERVMKLGVVSVAGNHDLMVAGLFADSRDQVDRMQATAYTSGTLAEDPTYLNYLAKLDLKLEREEFLVVHHSPFDLPGKDSAVSIHNFTYLDEGVLQRLVPEWSVFPFRLIVSGHDHLPFLYELNNEKGLVKRPIKKPPQGVNVWEESFKMDPSSRYWIKAGSVGGPYRDGIPWANTVMYDVDNATISFFRLAYDLRKLMDDLKANKFFRNIETIQRYIRTLHQWHQGR